MPFSTSHAGAEKRRKDSLVGKTAPDMTFIIFCKLIHNFMPDQGFVLNDKFGTYGESYFVIGVESVFDSVEAICEKSKNDQEAALLWKRLRVILLECHD